VQAERFELQPGVNVARMKISDGRSGQRSGRRRTNGLWIDNAVTYPLHENLDTWTDSGGSPPIAISTNPLRSTPSLSPGTTVPGFCLPMDLVW
jgi:hypothetical protein